MDYDSNEKIIEWKTLYIYIYIYIFNHYDSPFTDRASYSAGLIISVYNVQSVVIPITETIFSY